MVPMPSRLSVTDHRVRYQIWWLIQSSAGECTLDEMAKLTGESVETCRNICRWRGWTGQYRRTAQAYADRMADQGYIAELTAEVSRFVGKPESPVYNWQKRTGMQ
jgi:hypothetical protein